jgi:hypothetical protein
MYPPNPHNQINPSNLWSFYGDMHSVDYGPFAFQTAPYPGFYSVPTTYSYDYDRRPIPKSTELFDPNAPKVPKPKPTKSSRPPISIHPDSAFPKSSSHDSFFNPASQQTPPLPSLQYQPLFLPQGKQTNERTTTKSFLISSADQPLFLSFQAADFQTNILEICCISESGETRKEDLNYLLAEVKSTGATIKKYNSNTMLAIYSSAMAAQEALQKMNRKGIQALRPWNSELSQTV